MKSIRKIGVLTGGGDCPGLNAVIRAVVKTATSQYGWKVIGVAEGARQMGGEPVYLQDIGPGPRRLGGIGETLAAQLRERTFEEVRVTVLGHLQRGGSPSAFDRLLASRFGTMAVHLIAEGKFGYMVALEGEKIISVPIVEAIARQKLVPLTAEDEWPGPLSDMLLTAYGLGISVGRSQAELESLVTQEG